MKPLHLLQNVMLQTVVNLNFAKKKKQEEEERTKEENKEKLNKEQESSK